MNKYLQGSVHGRFQPLHNGHLKYILNAKERCNFLWVGITQYNIRHLAQSPQDPHRQAELNNPLTFNERLEIITSALLEKGITRDEFTIVPFPLETPDQLPDFVPKTSPVFTTICEEWNRHKIKVLEKAGYKVIVLWEDVKKEIDGINIRKMICEGDESWRKLVPQATIDVIEKYKIRDRIIKLNQK
jgi:cytidyltransferase-like protein